MRLTSEYRAIRALFTKPEEKPIYLEDPEIDEIFKTYFQVGPIIYYMKLDKIGTKCSVNFGYDHMVGTNDELIEYFSRLFKRRITDIDLRLLKDQFEYNPTGILRLGNSSKVFGHVLAILEDFISKYEISCIRFSAVRESRIDLYRHMIKRFLPDWEMQEIDLYGVTRFLVCKPEQEIPSEEKLKYPISF